MTAFYHSVYLPSKFNTDMRNNVLAARVRNGHIKREVALAEYRKPPFVEKRLVSLVRKRLQLTENQYNEIMTAPPHEWREYPTYKTWFEFLAPFFKFMVSRELVPKSFYLKYCRREVV
jgi:hypothetical protein